MSYDVLTIGRVGVDIYPLQAGVGLEDVETFGKFLGGSATNVAVAAARHGRRSAVITRTGADPFGRYVHQALRGFGVDDVFVTAVPGLPTPVTFCEVFPPDRFPIWFYRYPKAPDLEIRPEEIPAGEVRDARLYWATVTGLSAEPSRAAHFAAWQARGRTPLTVLDLDYRPTFWASREHAREQVRAALGQVTVAVGNLDECQTAVGTTDARAAAAALLAAGVELAVVKRGPDGVYARTADTEVEVPPIKVDVVNGLGAGCRAPASSSTTGSPPTTRATSRHSWLKLPVVDGMEEVMAATTLPALLLGGDPHGPAADTYARWAAALALPGVRGFVAGRALLYPQDGDVATAVDAACALVHGLALTS